MKRWTRLFVALSVVAMPVSTATLWWKWMTPIADIYTQQYSDCQYDWARRGGTEDACRQKALAQQQGESLYQLKGATIYSVISIALIWIIGGAILWTYRWIMRGER